MTLTVTDKQAEVIINALSEYFRLRQGFNFDLANDVASMYRETDDAFLSRRLYANMVYDTAYKIATDDGRSKGWHISGFTDNSAIAYDMWKDIRKALNYGTDTGHKESSEPEVTVR